MRAKIVKQKADPNAPEFNRIWYELYEITKGENQ